jgi:hypothetical protein
MVYSIEGKGKLTLAQGLNFSEISLKINLKVVLVTPVGE